ncbi:MAG: hypothetical protein ACPL88_13210, partial [Bryobacteraceae bacterium]
FGQTAFGMMHSRLGRFLVSSRFMRDLYGVTKVCAFVALALVHALRRGAFPRWLPAGPQIYAAGFGLTVFAVLLCLVRGIPVLFDARTLFRRKLPEEQ